MTRHESDIKIATLAAWFARVRPTIPAEECARVAVQVMSLSKRLKRHYEFDDHYMPARLLAEVKRNADQGFSQFGPDCSILCGGYEKAIITTPYGVLELD